VFGTILLRLERGRAEEDHAAVLDRGDAADGKAAAVARAVHFVDDRRFDVARTQEIGVQRMRTTAAGAAFHRGLRGGQRLSQHLATEHVLGADIAALAAEQVVFQPLQRQQLDQFGDDGFGSGHGRAWSMQWRRIIAGRPRAPRAIRFDTDTGGSNRAEPAFHPPDPP